MATITTDTRLDAAARTAGETWAINGAKLIIDVDTRWHANSPASMTGSLGAITISTTLGGTMQIDGTKVRWMPFNSGSGTVPAIGTTITQGGVSGYLLGVWVDYVSAPTAVGATMPTTGWIKFREVSGGTFSAGALTGISATATGPDVTGWIEVVMDQAAALSTSAIGTSLQWQGDWFSLGTTTGSPNQAIQVPTNGGGAATPVVGLSIETSPGSGIYEWYPAQSVANGFASININTDIRSKVVCHVGGGLVRIGSDGTTNIGYTPPAGCNIRIPNVFLRTCTTAARATNTAPTSVGSRPQVGGSSAPGVKALIDKIHIDWYLALYFGIDLNMSNNAIRDTLVIGFNQTPYTFNSNLVGCTAGFVAANFITASTVGGTVSNSKFHTVSGSTTSHLSLTDSTGATFTNNDFAQYSNANNSRQTISLTRCSNIVFNVIRCLSAHITMATCSNITITGYDYIDHSRGDTQLFSLSSSLFILNAGCNNITIDGITFGYGGTLLNTHPYFRIISTSNCNNITVRNAGTFAAPLYCGATNASAPSVIHDTTNDTNIKLQRLYFNFIKGIQSGNSPNSSSGILMEHIYGGDGLTNQVSKGADSTFRALRYSGSTLALPQMAGSHWQDYFSSATAGGVTWLANQISTASAPYNTLATASSSSGFTQSGTLSLKTAGDSIVSEMQYYAKGHTGFANSALSVTATGSYTYEYQIDTGTGWNGVWKIANGANLSAETISPSTGFKLKLRITANTSATTNLITRVTFTTVSTNTAQSSNLYDLSTSTLSFTGLVPGSEVRCYTGSDPATAVEIGGVESTAGSTFSFTHSAAGQVGFIRIFALGYQPISIDPYTFSSSDTSLLIQQVIDRNYVNP